jgi:hypothetical protein
VVLHCAAMGEPHHDHDRDNSAAITQASRLQLWFEQFRDLALIELALAGGIITLMGTVFQEAPRRGGAFVGVVALGLGAVCSLVAQAHVVDLSDLGKGPDQKLKILRMTTLLLLGVGSGSFVMFALRGLGLR